MDIHSIHDTTTLGPTRQGTPTLSSGTPIQQTAAECFQSGLVVPTVPLASRGLADQFQQLSSSTSEQLALYLPKQAPSSQAQGFPHKRIRTQEGRTYELLNTLNKADSALIKQQFKLDRTGKVVIGTGGFAKVRFAKNTETQHVVVVKKMPSIMLSNNTLNNSLDSATHETQIMGVIAQQCAVLKQQPEYQDIEESFALCLDHQHIARPNQPRGLENKSYLFYEFATDGDGVDHIERLSMLHNSGQHEKARHLLKHLALGFTKTVMHLHQIGVHHRDIKPENFLLFNAPEGQALPHIRLADFGFAHEEDYIEQWAGDTPAYAPPEAAPIHRNFYDAKKHDCFSLGMSLLTAKLEENPHHSKRPNHLTLRTKQGKNIPIKLKFYACKGDPAASKERCQGVHSSVLENLDMTHFDCIVAKLIAKKPADRISAHQAFDLLSQMP